MYALHAVIANILITRGQVLYRIVEIILAVIQPLYDQYAKLYDARYYILSRTLVRDPHMCIPRRGEVRGKQ